MTMTDNDEAGKLFVGGLSWETSKETLQTYFSKFGEVVDSVVMKNNETGRSRGFGFVTFKDPTCVSLVLQTKPHELNGRTVDPKECTPRSMQKRKGSNQGKVFLGGLPPDITETDIRGSLSRFGKVTQVSIMCDQETKKCRGFGFLSFESEDSTDQACAERFVTVNGKQVECKRAEPRENNKRNGGGQYGGGQNGTQGGYGAAPGYQAGWNQAPQAYGMQGGNTYGGGYQAYGAAPAVGAYGQSPMGYNAAPQYQQPAYGNYGGMAYGYPQPPAAGNYAPQQPAGQAYGQQPAAGNYPQAAPSANYGQAPAMGNDGKAPAAPANSYAANNYPQNNADGYGPTKNYGPGYQKQNAGDGSNYNQGGGGGAAGRNQGYHPYRR